MPGALSGGRGYGVPMAEAEELGTELAGFRRRVEELRTARALPSHERLSALDAALFELQHAADFLWPRYEALAASRDGGGGRGADGQEQRLLRALFQRMPLAVALLDGESVVRRLNFAATQLFSMRAGFATGRTLTGSLRHDGRAAFRSHVAAVARGEGGRSLVVHLPGRSRARPCGRRWRRCGRRASCGRRCWRCSSRRARERRARCRGRAVCPARGGWTWAR
ncbi:PAS domain-containing protein [Streptomyces stramineus]